MTWLDAARARLRLLFARRAVESRMDREFRLHIELETEQLMREQGLAPAEARRRALIAFGGVETHKEALRDGRGLAWLGGFALDLKLAARLLRQVSVVDGRRRRGHGVRHCRGRRCVRDPDAAPESSGCLFETKPSARHAPTARKSSSSGGWFEMPRVRGRKRN